MKKICIVTADVVGPCKNGGIGAHCYWLARNMADSGYDVTVFYTGPFVEGSPAYWRTKFSEMGIRFDSILDIPDQKGRTFGGGRAATHSTKVLRYLEDRHFDIIHFQEWHADGFIPIQAKRAGIALSDSILGVTMHSSRQWIREGMQRWAEQPMFDMMLDYCERYCVEHADVLFSPSRHMFEWAESKRWKLCDDRHVIPYCYIPDRKPAQPSQPDLSHIIFFGRLETRKGLEVFIDALSRVIRERPGIFRRVTFLGKDGHTRNGSGSDDIKRFRKSNPGINVDMLTDMDTFGAMRFLKDSGGVAAIPSLLDNYPYTVIECIQNAVHFIAAGTGGIPEMITSGNRLFEPTVEGLSGALARLDEIFSEKPVYAYSPEGARDSWLAVHERLLSARQPAANPPVARSYPKVSVCVPYYNHEKYLPMLLQSLDGSHYPNLEVVVVNDGSTREEAIKVFNDASRKYEGRGWKFLSKPNGGRSQARNYAAAHSEGEYLIFMDSDNVALPEMVSGFVDAITNAGTDCMTSHLYAFKGDGMPGSGAAPFFVYVPIGACVEAGLFENVFGDTNFIIKKDVFKELGGFGEERIGYEDYAILLLLCLKGYKLDVVPKQLFWYRRDRKKVINKYVNHQRIIKLYAEHCPENLWFIWPHLMSLYMQLNLQRSLLNRVGIRRIYEWLSMVYQNNGLYKGTIHIIKRVAGEILGRKENI